MNKEEIEKTKKGVLLNLEGHKSLLVSFGGIQQALGMPVFEFFNSISSIACDKIYLRDFNQAWYHKGVDDELDHINKITDYLSKKIDEGNYRKICFLGNSMGGYAALLFGSILKVDSVISFAPQTFIDPLNRLIYRDSRWRRQMKQVYRYEHKVKAYLDLKKHLKKQTPFHTSLNIYYSPLDVLDQRHAERLSKFKNVNLHPISEGGHAVVKILRDSGELQEIMQDCL